MKYGVALPTPVHETAVSHLLRSDGQEDLCFALWNPSKGRTRETALLREVILPDPGDRRVHGNASFMPQYLERAIAIARANGCGLALLHSHPAPGWQGMSPDDIRAEQGNAPAIAAATGLPFVGLTLGTDQAWSARFWNRVAPRQYERKWCESVRVVGDRMRVTFDENQCPPPSIGEELTRTVSAWGEATQADLARLTVGIVGAGSVGSIVAETLARMGVGHIRLFDFDKVERLNLDRLLHTTPADVGRFKVEVLSERLYGSATASNFRIDPLLSSVVEEDGFREALDCDVLFSCVDRPWGRCVLNFIAYAHVIPVIDGGLKLESNRFGTAMKRGVWRAHTAAPTRRCLECLGQYEPSHVSTERDGYLDHPKYIEGLPHGHELRAKENVFPASVSVAAMEVNQFLRMFVPHPGHANAGAETYNLISGTLDVDHRRCEDTCYICSLTAKGDRSGLNVTGRHPIAEAARSTKKRSLPTPFSDRIIKWLRECPLWW